MSEAPKLDRPMTAQEFLAWDSGDDLAWELVDGLPRLKFPANPGLQGHAAPSDEHGVIVQNLAVALTVALRAERRPCRVIAGAALSLSRPLSPLRSRVRIPDLTVKCGRSAREAGDALLVAEVISPSNSARDMAEREADYRSLASVREIVVIEQDRPVVVLHRRVGDLWRVERLEGFAAVLTLESGVVAVPLSELYRDVLDSDGATDGGAG